MGTAGPGGIMLACFPQPFQANVRSPGLRCSLTGRRSGAGCSWDGRYSALQRRFLRALKLC